ncbi:MAG: radical SAM family heme chaperone HemW [Lachnospiraceae bacterium]|nr:radical SAM family heme chaperone HemW [Lachnospiraceae bacterium]
MSDFELYVHLPFCVQKCLYCDFTSGVFDGRLQRDYLKVICEEIKESACRYKGRLSSVYIGGGTPSMLPLYFIEEICNTISDNFEILPGAEISIEANPGTVTREKAKGYLDLGINRISMGLQSADDAELKRLGRIHSYRDFLESYDSLRKAGFPNINIDLMSGLPGQTQDSLAASLKEVLLLRPEHISVYSLIIEEGTPFYDMYHEDALRQEKGEDTMFLPGEDETVSMLHLTENLLLTSGYNKYEISNFSKPGFECRHNIGYWKRTPYVGVGLGAASLISPDILREGDMGSAFEVRYANTKDMKTYLYGEKIGGFEELKKSDAMSEFMFLGLRMTEGISISEFYEAFGITPDAIYKEHFRKLSERNLIINEDGRIRLTPFAMDVSNIVLAAFV